MARNVISTNTTTPKKTDTWRSTIRRWVLKAVLYFFVGSLLWVTLLKFVPVWFTPYMMSQKIEAWMDGRSGKIYSDWTSMEEMSKEAPLAVVASEDQLFPQHWGFDFKSMGNAFKHN
ncbi:MAG: transglycosylase domain-containing protein, partial [Spirosomaceae bacterium]|nr:transglycosylase domain-containing protein [Spirosomataceae bacterium]